VYGGLCGKGTKNNIIEATKNKRRHNADALYKPSGILALNKVIHFRHVVRIDMLHGGAAVRAGTPLRC
jgi:hypothetical protein